MLDRHRVSLGCALALALAAGCAGGEVYDGEDGSVRDASPTDTGTIADGSPPLTTRDEVCGNGVDDDGNGRIDDGCECVVGTVRDCWLGPPDARNVGQCRVGQQACEPEGEEGSWGFCVDQTSPSTEIAATGVDEDCDGAVDEDDARCVPTRQLETSCMDLLDDDCDGLTDCLDPDCSEECTNECTPTESLCWGGADEDCDGQADCDDPDCAGEQGCGDDPCIDGEGLIFTERAPLDPIVGPPQVESGDGDPLMPSTCGESRCMNGQVEVRLAGGGFVCAPPPPSCPDGQHPTYRTGGRWTCDPPCDRVIRYGYLYDFRRVCGGEPDVVCMGTEVPTFLAEEQRWVCAPICDNTLYDRIFYDGQLVCLPC